ncbi:MAG: glycosyltransferase family 39 protein, partial [Anaerolineae bacterium]|nr:glycosyltransferase family 39 protein [Anaerolineae bacterium]
MTDSHGHFTPRLLLGWLIVSLICLVPILLHQSDEATLLGRYSTRYALMLVAMLGLTGLAGGLYILTRGDRLKLPVVPLPQTRAAGWLIAGGGSLLIALVWAFLPVSNVGGGIVFRVYVVGLLIAAMLLLLGQTHTARLPVAPLWFWLLLLGAGIVVLALNVSLIGTLPPSRFFEEPILADWAISSHDPTVLASHMFPARDPASGNIYLTNLSSYLLGFWEQGFGVDLVTGRVFARLLAYLGLPFIYLTARRLYGPAAALGAIVIAVFLPVHHGYLRTNMLVATTNALALYCFFSARDAGTNRGRLTRHFLAGFGVAIGVEGHPYAAAFAAGMSLVYALEYALRIRQSRQWQWSGFWSFGLGALGAVLFFVAFRIFSSKGIVTPSNFIESLIAAYTHETNIGNSAD